MFELIKTFLKIKLFLVIILIFYVLEINEFGFKLQLSDL